MNISVISDEHKMCREMLDRLLHHEQEVRHSYKTGSNRRSRISMSLPLRSQATSISNVPSAAFFVRW